MTMRDVKCTETGDARASFRRTDSYLWEVGRLPDDT
jgi:hypothetical protein